jgi:hypothetical protein
VVGELIALTSVLEIASCKQLDDVGRPRARLIRLKTPLNLILAVFLYERRKEFDVLEYELNTLPSKDGFS